MKTHSPIECGCRENVPTGICRSLLLSEYVNRPLGGTFYKDRGQQWRNATQDVRVRKKEPCKIECYKHQ